MGTCRPYERGKGPLIRPARVPFLCRPLQKSKMGQQKWVEVPLPPRRSALETGCVDSLFIYEAIDYNAASPQAPEVAGVGRRDLPILAPRIRGWLSSVASSSPQPPNTHIPKPSSAPSSTLRMSAPLVPFPWVLAVLGSSQSLGLTPAPSSLRAGHFPEL